jgi:formylglycine-generating enzyme required for sulfatase activity
MNTVRRRGCAGLEERMGTSVTKQGMAAESPPGPEPAKDMVWIPGGTFCMGSDTHYPEEAPAHEVTVAGFWIDRYQVTNAAFRRFIKATGYATLAERVPNPMLYPGAKAELLVSGSVVFRQPKGRVALTNHYAWWDWLPGPTGVIRKAPAAPSRAGNGTQWFMWPGKTSSRMRSGPARACPQRPRGSTPAVAVRRAKPSPRGFEQAPDGGVGDG